MNIYPIFHISLLELVDSGTPLETNAVATDEITQEYKVKKIIDTAIRDSQEHYLVK
jgi:hypothetical protein